MHGERSRRIVVDDITGVDEEIRLHLLHDRVDLVPLVAVLLLPLLSGHHHEQDLLALVCRRGGGE